MKSLILTLGLLITVLLAGCSSDDSTVLNDDFNNAKLPNLGQVNDSISVEVYLKGRVLGNVTLHAIYQNDIISEAFKDEVVDTTLIGKADFLRGTEEFTLQMAFGTWSFEIAGGEYEPAVLRIKTQLNDEIVTDIDTTIAGPQFTYSETLKL